MPTAAAPVEPAPRRSGAARAALVAVAVFLLLGLGAYGLYRVLGPTTPSSAAVTVPDVVGSTRAEAETALREVDLVPRVQNVSGEDDESRGTVVDQTPEGGTGLAAQGVVELRVNVGPDTATVPEGLVGEDVDEVRDELAAAGFTSVRTEEVASPTDDDEQGEVLSVDPGEGEEVALDEDVVVRYASGRRAGGGASSRPDGSASAPAPTRSSDEPTASQEPSATREPTERPTDDEDDESDESSAPPAPSSRPSSSTEPAAPPGPSSSATAEERERKEKKPKEPKEPRTKGPEEPEQVT